MAYTALYRQWRPTTFSEMVGQEHLITALRNQVTSGRIAHAYLFCGSRGTGKTSAAKILARAVNCERPENGDPCGECDSCRRLLREESLDVIEMDAASNSTVDQMRDLLDNVIYPPQYGKYKVYIVDEVHMLSNSAFNALLKTLEEPPAHVVFILATTDPQKLPATILSRCQRYDFGRIPADQIVQRLREAADGAGRQAEDKALYRIARSAEGGMRDALSLLDMCIGYGEEITDDLVRSLLGTSDADFLFRFTEALGEEDAAAVMRLIDELMRSGREPIVFARDMSEHLRSLLVAKACPGELPALLDVTEDAARELEGQADRFTETRLMSMQELFMGTETSLRYASSPRNALEAAALKACLRTGEEDTAALRQRVEELEQAVRRLTEQLAAGAWSAPAPAQTKPEKKTAEPATKAAPRPKEQTAGGRSSDTVWKDMMIALRRGADIPLHAMLTSGKFIGCRDGVYRWEGDKVYLAVVQKQEKQALIERLLSEGAGAPVTFEPSLPGQEKKTAGESEKEMLSQLQEAFGRENLLIQEELPGEG